MCVMFFLQLFPKVNQSVSSHAVQNEGQGKSSVSPEPHEGIASLPLPTEEAVPSTSHQVSYQYMDTGMDFPVRYFTLTCVYSLLCFGTCAEQGERRCC